MTRRRFVACAAALAALVAPAGCSRGGNPVDAPDALVADTTISDTDAVRRAVERERMWEVVIGPALWKPPDPRVPRIGERGIWTDTDASGAPALHIAWAPGVSIYGSLRTSRKGEHWTVGQERSQDDLGLSMERKALARVARVGEARRLRFIELTFFKIVRIKPWSERTPLPKSENGLPSPKILGRLFHDPDEAEIAVFRAVIPHENLGRIANTKFEDLWSVEFDCYDTLEVESIPR